MLGLLLAVVVLTVVFTLALTRLQVRPVPRGYAWFGGPIFESPLVPPGTLLIGHFPRGFLEQPAFSFRSEETDFGREVVIRSEMRLSLSVIRPEALVTVTL